MKINLTLRRAQLLAVGCLISLGVSAQVFQKVGTGLSPAGTIYSQVMIEDNGNIYAGYSTYLRQGQTYINNSFVERWDGLAWHKYPALVDKQITDIAIFQNDVYVSAFDINNGYNGNVFKFDGTAWNPVFTGITGSVSKLAAVNGKLAAAGGFTHSGTGQHNLIGYDGTSTTTYPPLHVNDSISDMKVINGELWVTGRFGGYNNNDTSSIKRLSGGTWHYPAIAHKPVSNWSYCYMVFQYNGKIYSLENSKLYEIRNDTAHYVANSYAHTGAESNGNMYLANGNNMYLFNGTTISTIVGAPNRVGALASNSTALFGMFNDTSKINGQYYNNVFKTNGQYGLMGGKTFVDRNGNCTYEPSIDDLAGYMRITSTAGPTASFNSSWVGDYQVALAAGAYTFTPGQSYTALNKYLVPACNTTNSVSIVNGQSVTKDFVLTHDGTVDVESHISASRGQFTRQGFTERYKLKVSNPGASLVNPVSVSITIPSTVTFMGSNPSPAGVSGNVLTYSFAGLGERAEKEVMLDIRIDRTQNPLNSYLEYYSNVTGPAADVDLANNKDTLRVKVVAACDPNDKNANVEQARPGLSSLDYHIRFQNTGTDTAFKVVIVDTLESYFKIEELQINDASHSYDLNVLDDHILVWTFDNILLPDSGANQLGSQGFIDFTIGVDNTLPLGSIIDNDAEIYFDYQPAVHTNHAQTQIVMNVSLAENSKALLIDIFPNPAKDELNIINHEAEAIEFQLINSAGVVVEQVVAQPEFRTSFRVNSLGPGLYLLQGKNATYKIVVQ